MASAQKRAWTILGVVFVLFFVGLFIVSFWGGPYQADSLWQRESPPAYPN